jgi:hypothetical protein
VGTVYAATVIRSVRLVSLMILSGAVGGCANAVAIPSGAQQIHVVATATEVHVAPATVHPGDIYLVLDLPHVAGPNDSALAAQGVELEMVGPLTDAALAQLAQTGDAGEGVGYQSLGVAYHCGLPWEHASCGNVYKETLAVGKYAFDLGGTSGPQPVPPTSMGVLDVQP